MPREKIEKLAEKIKSAQAIDPATKAELLKLLGALENEFSALEESRPDAAESIAGFMRVSAHVHPARNTPPDGTGSSQHTCGGAMDNVPYGPAGQRLVT